MSQDNKTKLITLIAISHFIQQLPWYIQCGGGSLLSNYVIRTVIMHAGIAYYMDTVIKWSYLLVFTDTTRQVVSQPLSTSKIGLRRQMNPGRFTEGRSIEKSRFFGNIILYYQTLWCRSLSQDLISEYFHCLYFFSISFFTFKIANFYVGILDNRKWPILSLALPACLGLIFFDRLIFSNFYVFRFST